MFGSIDEDLERLFDAFLPDVLRKPSRSETSLHRHVLDELTGRHGAIGRIAKRGATANGGTSFRDHATSIPDGLELLFGCCLVRQHAGDAPSYWVMTSAPLADQFASVDLDRAPVYWTCQ